MLGLIQTLNIRFDKTEKEQPFSNLQRKTKQDQLFFLDIFDRRTKKYYGNFTESKFKIRMPYGSYFSRANGVINKKNSKLEIRVFGYNWFNILYFFVIFLIFGLSLNDILKSKSNYGTLIPLVTIFLFLTLFPLYKLRNQMKSFIKELELDLKN